MIPIIVGFLAGQLFYQIVMRPFLFPQYTWGWVLRMWGRS